LWKKITNGATRCIECNGKYLRIVERPTKEELKNILINLKGNLRFVEENLMLQTTLLENGVKFMIYLFILKIISPSLDKINLK